MEFLLQAPDIICRITAAKLLTVRTVRIQITFIEHYNSFLDKIRMNKKLIYILAAALPLAYSTCQIPLHAQDYVSTPVTVSAEKVKLGGKLFYSHIVLEKQTIFSISKAYNTTVDEIYAANPGLKESGLKKNAIILIPIAVESAAKSATTEAALETKSADVRQAKQENTSASVSEKREKEEDEEEPKQERRKKNKTDKDDFIIHTVRWFEDLDVISEKYGVPVDMIMEINGLSGRKLKNRQKLRIPADIDKYLESNKQNNASTANDRTEKEISGTEKKSLKETLFPSKENIPAEKLRPAIKNNEVNVVLMLPFNAQDSAGCSKTSFDFYSGALMAAKKAGDNGTNVDLSVYDVAGGNMPITVERLEKTDVVIGPVAQGALDRLLEITPLTTYVISPLDHRAEHLASTHRNFIQAPTSSSMQYADMIKWLSDERNPGDQVLVIYEKGIRKSQDADILSLKLKEAGINYNTFSYSILEGRNILDSLKGKMTLQNTNRLIIASESEAFVNDVVRNINLMIYNKYKTVIYAPSRIRSFETIEVENLHNANLHVTSAYYVDYSDPEVMSFIKEYRALYNAEPSPFAFQGYDITRYFIDICAKYGENWYDFLQDEKGKMLQSDFNFKRERVGIADIGYINTAAKRIVYGPDYSITLSKGL